jgi:ribose/xylose/arabinose/galactoside ABC-type transport system permease subunit
LQPILIIVAAVLAIGGITQLVAITQIVLLRRRLGHLPQLEEQPWVRVWLVLCAGLTVVCTLATITTVIVAKEDGEPFLAGLGSVALMFVAYLVANNDTRQTTNN